MFASTEQAQGAIGDARAPSDESCARKAAAAHSDFTAAEAAKADKIAHILNRTPNAVLPKGAPCFVDPDCIANRSAESGLKGRLQETLKQHGRLYYTLLTLLQPVWYGSAYCRRRRDLLAGYDLQSVIVNLGSGPTFFAGRKDVINVDIFPFREVDIVADATDLPLESESVDLLINVAMLEHVVDPVAVVREMHRVSKVGGRVFCYLPFVSPYHAAPKDFWRWTLSGVKELFAPFDDLEVAVACGPTSGMLWVFQEWAATLLSFGSTALHDVLFMLLMVLTCPVKLLDALLAKYPNAPNTACSFFVVGRKT